MLFRSTILPAHCEALAKQCAELGVLFLDAPVSGGGGAAAAGKLTVMCGGDAEAFERAGPVFASFAGLTVRLGEAGSGQRAKLINNALMAAHMGLAHAALGAGDALHIDRTALAELIKQSSGRSFGFEVYARLPTPAAFTHGAPLLAKDVALLAEVLGDDDNAAVLRAAADHFLAAAAATRNS